MGGLAWKGSPRKSLAFRKDCYGMVSVRECGLGPLVTLPLKNAQVLGLEKVETGRTISGCCWERDCGKAGEIVARCGASLSPWWGSALVSFLKNPSWAVQGISGLSLFSGMGLLSLLADMHGQDMASTCVD